MRELADKQEIRTLGQDLLLKVRSQAWERVCDAGFGWESPGLLQSPPNL